MILTSRRRKRYDTSYKLKAIEWAEQSSKEAAAREFGVDAKRIRVWCSQKDKLPAMKKKSTRKRLDEAGRKPNNVEMEELFGWIVDLLPVTCMRHNRWSKHKPSRSPRTTVLMPVVAGSIVLCSGSVCCYEEIPPSLNLFLVTLYPSSLALCCICDHRKSATNIRLTAFSSWTGLRVGWTCDLTLQLAAQVLVPFLWKYRPWEKTLHCYTHSQSERYNVKAFHCY